jgi:membrane fusion protein, multidrug efflux system
VHTADSILRCAERRWGSLAARLACAIAVGVVLGGTSAQAEGALKPVARKDAVRGIVRAIESAMISTDLQTRVVRIGFQEGERFKKGDLLVQFDCGRQMAGLAGAEAQQLEMQLTLDKYKMLQKAQAVGRNELEISEARVAKAAADTQALRAQLVQCTLVAPFDGRVLELGLHEHETAQPGKPFIGIVAEGGLEIDLIVPSDWARWVKPGFDFAFQVDETQTAHEVSVKRIGAAVDPISQTIKIVATFRVPAENVLPGMSGTAQITRAGG